MIDSPLDPDSKPRKFETLIRRMATLRHEISDLLPQRGTSGCLLNL